MCVPKTDDGRLIFVLPWLGKTLVGTTEHKLDSVIDDPTPTLNEVKWLSRQISKLYNNEEIEVILNIKSKWCGVRPLVMNASSSGEIDSKQVARSHVIEESKSGLVSIMGGKWTTYRLMAEETINQI